jgi:uncharacterized protein YkwD
MKPYTSIYHLSVDIQKSSATVKNKQLLISQLDAKIKKATFDREKAAATLPIYIKQNEDYIQMLRELYNKKNDATHLEEAIDSDTFHNQRDPERHSRTYYTDRLNKIRAILNLPPLTIPETTDNPN